MDGEKNGKIAAFVAGATGFTGREVVRALASAGLEVTAHVRPDSDRLDEWRERFEKMGARVDTTAWNRDALAATMEKLRPDVVFALLGTVRARAKKARRAGRDPAAESYEAVDYGLTVTLLDALGQAGVRARFVYLSAAGVKPSAVSPYYKARARAEAAIRESGLPYTIARPSFITGPGRDDKRTGERIGARIADGFLALGGLFGAHDFRARYSSTTNVVLAKSLVEIGLDPARENKAAESEDLRGPPLRDE